MHLCAISGKGLVIFGHWRRGAVTACGLRTEDPVFFLERGGIRGVRGGWLRNTLLWMSCYPAVSLWLTVGLSEAVSVKSTTYQLSGLKSTLLVHWSLCFCVNPCRKIFSVPSVFCSWTSEGLSFTLQLKIYGFLQHNILTSQRAVKPDTAHSWKQKSDKSAEKYVHQFER